MPRQGKKIANLRKPKRNRKLKIFLRKINSGSTKFFLK